MNVFNLEAVLNLNSDNYNQGLSNASQGMSEFSTASIVKGQLIADAIEEIATKMIDLGKSIFSAVDDIGQLGDTIDKQSQKLGISNRAYQEWSFILQHAGSDISTLRPAMKTLSAAVNSNAEEFTKLGLSMQNISNMSEEELFSAVISSLQNMEQGTERNAVASKLLGRAYMELSPLLNMTSEKTDAMRQSFEDLGGVMSDEAVKQGAAYEDTLLDMQTAIDGTKREILGGLVPAMTDFASQVTAFVRSDAGKRIANNAKTAITKIFDALKKVDFEKIINGILDGVVNFTTFIINNFGTIVTWIKAVANAFIAWKIATVVGRAITAISSMIAVVQSLGGVMATLSTIIAANPIGAFVVGITALVGVISLLSPKIAELNGQYNAEIGELKTLNSELNAQKDAYNQVHQAALEQTKAIEEQYGTYETLVKELENCYDENGKLKDSEKARAELIAGQLSEALGTEITATDTMTDALRNQITETRNLIEAQKSKALMAAYEEEYQQALKNQKTNLDALRKATDKYIKAQQEMSKYTDENGNILGVWTVQAAEANAVLYEASQAYDTATAAVKNDTSIMTSYESAWTKARQGNYQEAVQIMQNHANGYGNLVNSLSDSNRQLMNNSKAYMTEMLRQAGYSEQEIVAITNRIPSETNTYSQMVQSGRNSAQGWIDGYQERMKAAKVVAINSADVLVRAFNNSLGQRSPSRRFMQSGKYSLQGYEIGWNNYLPKVIKTVTDSMDFIDDLDVSDKSFGFTAEVVPTKVTAESRAMDNVTTLLNTLIEKIDTLGNQQIVLDTGVLVGETAPKMDEALGSLAIRNGRSVFA